MSLSRFVPWALAVTAACSSTSSTRTAPPIANTAPPIAPDAAVDADTQPHLPPQDLERLVHLILERFTADASTVADGGLLPGGGAINVVVSAGPVSVNALPPGPGRPFRLATLAELQAEADLSKHSVYYIQIWGPSLMTDTQVELDVGVDFVQPKDDKRGKLCCCTDFQQFERTPTGDWKFVEVTGGICS